MSRARIDKPEKNILSEIAECKLGSNTGSDNKNLIIFQSNAAFEGKKKKSPITYVSARPKTVIFCSHERKKLIKKRNTQSVADFFLTSFFFRWEQTFPSNSSYFTRVCKLPYALTSQPPQDKKMPIKSAGRINNQPINERTKIETKKRVNHFSIQKKICFDALFFCLLFFSCHRSWAETTYHLSIPSKSLHFALAHRYYVVQFFALAPTSFPYIQPCTFSSTTDQPSNYFQISKFQ